MAPRKKPAAAAQVAEEPVAEDTAAADEPLADDDDLIEEIVPEPQADAPEAPQGVTFVLDNTGYLPRDAVEYDEPEDEDEEDDDELITAVGQLTQLMMTEEGEAITDVLNGVREAIDKQNKILYRGLQLLEARFGGGGGRR